MLVHTGAGCVSGKASLPLGEKCSEDFECQSTRCDLGFCAAATQGWLYGEVASIADPTEPAPGLNVIQLDRLGRDTDNVATTGPDGAFQLQLPTEPVTLRIVDPEGTWQSLAWVVSVSEGVVQLPFPILATTRDTVQTVHGFAGLPVRADGFIVVQPINQGAVLDVGFSGEVIVVEGVSPAQAGYLATDPVGWFDSSNPSRIEVQSQARNLWGLFFNADAAPGQHATVKIEFPPNKQCHRLFGSKIDDYPLIPTTYTYVPIFCYGASDKLPAGLF